MCPLERPRSSAPAAESRADLDADAAAHQARLARLRQALQSGSYRPQAQQIAAQLLASGDLG